VIGYTADRDAENWRWARAGNRPRRLWTATARTSRLDRARSATLNTVASVPTGYDALELGWKGGCSASSRRGPRSRIHRARAANATSGLRIHRLAARTSSREATLADGDLRRCHVRFHVIRRGPIPGSAPATPALRSDIQLLATPAFCADRHHLAHVWPDIARDASRPMIGTRPATAMR
jgi:hypothetical protein